MAKNLLSLNNSQPVTRHLSWKGWVPFKCKFFAWRASINRLPTKIELIKRGVSLPCDMCDLCNSVEETSTHLFTGCVFAAEIWSRVEAWCRMAPIFAFEVSDLLKLAGSQATSKDNKYILRGIMISTMWALWNERNNRIFNNKNRRAIEVVENIKSTSFFWIRNRSKFKGIDWIAWCNFPLNVM